MHHAIIKFWFEEIDSSQWWVKDEAFDQLIQANFSTLHQQAINGELDVWRKTSAGRLAEIIILDQFSRNIYRDTPKAFACDAQAVALAQEAVAGGFDLSLSVVQRSFLYMPYMHSESLYVHDQAERLFAQLGVESTLEFERKHRRIIEQFGRYPHRNSILGRTSSVEEIAFLSQPDSSF
jgi:uncharacterized protein (DUF924 family)